jgi:hypothetical protein
LGGTSLAVDVPHGPALPFAGQEAPKPKRKRSELGKLSFDLKAAAGIAPPPAQKAEPPAPSAEPPTLDLEQHASLTAEIAFAPERALATLAEYGLTPEAKRAADDHYRAKVAASPEVREAWNRTYREYYEWLRDAAGR